jgi:hypothetical protein
LQVSNEYKLYKSEAEQHLEQLQQERDAYKEELQLALTTTNVSKQPTASSFRAAAISGMQGNAVHAHAKECSCLDALTTIVQTVQCMGKGSALGAFLAK